MFCGVGVVSYRNSTSNHNIGNIASGATKLYLIEILHQTTTRIPIAKCFSELYLIEILHQTTTVRDVIVPLSRLYLIEILHQTTTNVVLDLLLVLVVSYRNSTSNHNYVPYMKFPCQVVSYRNSTSNHNKSPQNPTMLPVVSYRNSTSNHNEYLLGVRNLGLYLIEILHQTTTSGLILIDKVLLTGCLPL